jgi:Zn-dependent peptidase ImmA (M78 family)
LLGAKSGVAIVFVPELPKSRAYGATRWLNPVKALIQLSLRYKTNDHLWFTFFHEAGHIVLHGKRKTFLEGDGHTGSKSQESEADRFACDHLIPLHDYESLVEAKPITSDAVKQFAKRIGIAPGIVVGRLQHDGHLPYTHLNALKVSYRWVVEED